VKRSGCRAQQVYDDVHVGAGRRVVFVIGYLAEMFNDASKAFHLLVVEF